MELELEIWRAIGRTLLLEESLPEIARLLARRFPLDTLLVRRLNVEQHRLDTVAVGSRRDQAVAAGESGGGGRRSPQTGAFRTECTEAELETLLRWCRKGDLLRGEADESPLLRRMVPGGLAGACAALPLLVDDEPTGVALFLSSRHGNLWEAHRAAVLGLREPLSAALQNDLHFQELVRLREALEADKRALLSRLQRDDIVDSIVGSDTGLRDVMAKVEQVAHTDAPVLIFGETGTGKEVVARAIHQRSRRVAGPMVRVNCGAIPPELVDSELFGHEKGSFTGAVASRKGWFERADGGTLFLDEFGELSQAAQVRLLRILQDGTLERVGGQNTLTVDVRIVAATNLDLASMVTGGTFREDLWYRISVFPIRLPPLRERRQDIPALSAHFAWRSGKRLGAGPLAPTAADTDLLLSYDWPGNVRELAAVIERATILGGGRKLEVAAALGVARRVTPQVASAPSQPDSPDAPFPTLDEAMCDHIARALGRTHGRIEGAQGAAALLDINPHTLRARMRKQGLDWTRYRC